MKIQYSEKHKQIQIDGEGCLMLLGDESKAGFEVIGVLDSDLKLGICGFNVVNTRKSKSKIIIKIKWIIAVIKFKL